MNLSATRPTPVANSLCGQWAFRPATRLWQGLVFVGAPTARRFRRAVPLCSRQVLSANTRRLPEQNFSILHVRFRVGERAVFRRTIDAFGVFCGCRIWDIGFALRSRVLLLLCVL